MYKRQDYLAIGAGAHGKVSRVDRDGALSISRYWNHRHPKAYLQAVENADFCAQQSSVQAASRDFEFLMNALRMVEGFSLPMYEQRTGGEESRLLEKLEPLFDKGWLEREGSSVRASAQGFRFLDSVLLELV